MRYESIVSSRTLRAAALGLLLASCSTESATGDDADADAALPSDAAGGDAADLDAGPGVDTDSGLSPEVCPSPNPAFSAGCEPALAACSSTTDAVLAASYRGTFGSVGSDGTCQNAWPDPWLSDCTEPLPEGVPDLRGLWADEGHVERVEQCGNLILIVGDNYTHGGFATGVVEDGVNDFRADGSCAQPIQVALRFNGTALEFVQGGTVVVTRTLETAADGSDELVWRFGPALTELARMRRYCSLSEVPPTAVSGLP
jgi:hypothetical protein